jgi:hypothetical protein
VIKLKGTKKDRFARKSRDPTTRQPNKHLLRNPSMQQNREKQHTFPSKSSRAAKSTKPALAVTVDQNYWDYLALAQETYLPNAKAVQLGLFPGFATPAEECPHYDR